PNTYRGTTTLNNGTLNVGMPSALSPDALVLTNGTFQAAASLTLANAFSLTNSVVTLGNNVPITFTGAGTLSGTNTVNVSNTGGTYITGALKDGTSAGQLILQGTNGILFL